MRDVISEGLRGHFRRGSAVQVECFQFDGAKCGMFRRKFRGIQGLCSREAHP